MENNPENGADFLAGKRGTLMSVERPSLDKLKAKRRSTSMYLTDQTLARLKTLADAKDLSASEVAESLLEWALDAYERPQDDDGDGSGDGRSRDDSHQDP